MKYFELMEKMNDGMCLKLCIVNNAYLNVSCGENVLNKRYTDCHLNVNMTCIQKYNGRKLF